MVDILGGAYKFYNLAPSLITEDEHGISFINPEYNADMLASAVALHEGFSYDPDEKVFWKQAKSSENSYLFVTTRHVTKSFVDSIIATMNAGEMLLIACQSFDGDVDKAYSNIKVKKIPQMLLNRCEFNKDDYSLNIVSPPIYDDLEEDDE